VFQSRTDWRKRMAAAQTLGIRLANLSVVSADLAEIGVTYVFPKNLLKRFVQCADLRTSIGAFVYGRGVKESENVMEIRCLVFVPQLGTHEGVQLASKEMSHPALEGLEPLGWIATSSIVSGTVTPSLAKKHAHLVEQFDLWTPQSVVFVVGFPPGSVEIAGFSMTLEGLQWASESMDTSNYSVETHTRHEQLMLTDAFNGFLLSPPRGVFHYNFNQAKFSPDMSFSLNVLLPLPFYAPEHRVQHFLAFSAGDDGAQELD
jgi:pre-mRNA-processing factor 8